MEQITFDPMRETQPEVNAEDKKNIMGEQEEPVSEEPAVMPDPDIGEKCCPDAAGGDANPASAEGENQAPKPEAQIRVKFNKQERTYSVGQAVPLVEMGLKWDSFRPLHEKLRYLASAQGRTVPELIDHLLEDSDNQLFRQLVDELGGNENAASRLFEVQKSDRKKRFEQMCEREEKQERLEEAAQLEQTEQKLADEFLWLASEFPGRFTGFADVPAPVVEDAVRENLSLFDAYLRHEHLEAKRAAAEQIRQAQTAARSAGSLCGAYYLPETELDSFEQAFYKALR